MVVKERPLPRESRGRVVWFWPKVNPPAVRPGIVVRERLVSSLCASDAIEVVIAAPPGYGKSTLGSTWADRDARPFGWITVDEADNDPVVFLNYVALALESIRPIDDSLVDEFATGSLPWAAMLPRVLDIVAAMPEPFVLVVDDAHRLQGPTASKVLPAIASRIPTGSAIAILTRGPIPYPTTRGVVGGRVFRLNADDLAMRPNEAEALLLAAGITADRWESEALHEKIEGWPAGLYMAALALRNAQEPDEALRHFTGGDRLVTEYLTEEILQGLPTEDVEFLLATSVLTRLSGDLCDETLQASGSGATLERMAGENQFVIPLDHHGEWYRYHHLFGEMLRTEMHARQPEVVHSVARRASAWFEAHGELEPAIEHALIAHDERAAALIWRYSPAMLGINRVDTVSLWLAEYTDEDIERIPALTMTAAWQRLALGDIGSMHRLVAALESKRNDRLPDGAPVSAMLGILHALTRPDGLEVMRRNAAEARTNLPPESPYCAIASYLEGCAAAYLGDLAEARERLHEGMRLARARLPAVYAQCVSQLARVEFAEGNSTDGDRHVDEAMRVLSEHHLRDRPPACVCFAIAAASHTRRGNTALGNHERVLARSLLEQCEDLSPYQLLGAQLDLAVAAIIADDLDDARSLLDDVERRLAWLPGTGTLAAGAASARSLFDAASSKRTQLVEPLTHAELRVLAYLPTHLSFGEIGAALYVSRNTVKSHAMAIYRKLGVTSRSEAVLEAKQFGLVDDPPRTRP